MPTKPNLPLLVPRALALAGLAALAGCDDPEGGGDKPDPEDSGFTVIGTIAPPQPAHDTGYSYIGTVATQTGGTGLPGETGGSGAN